MSKLSTPARRARVFVPATLAALAALVAGCGQWVSAEDYVPGATGDSGAGGVTVRADVKSLTHAALADVTGAFVKRSADGAFVGIDYDALRADADLLFKLEGYLQLVASVDPSGLVTREHKLAYWINGYNAAVIKGVLDAYNGDHSFKTVDLAGFFSGRRFVFAGIKLSLNQIEHGAVRGDFDARVDDFAGLAQGELDKLKAWHKDIWGKDTFDSRLHAAFNCGALSCPNLPSEAPFVFDPLALDKQLDDTTKAWLDSADKGAGPNGVSKLFEWYRVDFERSHSSVEGFIKAFRTGGVGGVDLTKSLDYDWTLNSTNNLPSK